MEPLNFDDIALIEIPVKIGSKRYVLREATGDAACKYKNAQMACAKFNADGKPAGVGNMADTEPLLVSLCLFEVDDQGQPLKTSVPLQTVRGWPARIQKALFEKVQAISQLEIKETKETLTEKIDRMREQLGRLENGTEEDHAKNSHGTTMAGSI